MTGTAWRKSVRSVFHVPVQRDHRREDARDGIASRDRAEYALPPRGQVRGYVPQYVAGALAGGDAVRGFVRFSGNPAAIHVQEDPSDSRDEDRSGGVHDTARESRTVDIAPRSVCAEEVLSGQEFLVEPGVRRTGDIGGRQGEPDRSVSPYLFHETGVGSVLAAASEEFLCRLEHGGLPSGVRTEENREGVSRYPLIVDRPEVLDREPEQTHQIPSPSSSLIVPSAGRHGWASKSLVESPQQSPQNAERQMRIGISGTHGTGKTTLIEALCAHLPGHLDPSEEAGTAAVQPAFGNLDLLVIMPITPETERVLPAAEMPGLRSQMNDALLELVYDDPLNAWGDIPVLELSGPLDRRLDAVLAALDQARRPGRRHRAPSGR
jgi:hypothetical protein